VSEPVTTKVHAWHIAEREYVRHERRRGRRYAYEVLDPVRTALVVIDMVPFFVEEMEYCRGIVPNIQRLATCLRDAGGTIAWVLPGRSLPPSIEEEFLGPEVADMYRRCGGEGPLRERLWHEFDVRREDLLVEKSAPSAFFPGRSGLPSALEGRGVDTVLIAGTVTNVCCESSARDASTLGYRVLMVADANAAGSDEVHNATLHTVYRSFGDVRPTTEVISLVMDGRDAASGNERTVGDANSGRGSAGGD
jgi:nicotinamidase-related amidase